MSINSNSVHNESSGYQTIDLDQDSQLTSSSTAGSASTVRSPYHTNLNTTNSSSTHGPLITSPNQQQTLTRAQEEEESVRVRIELAKHTPWKQFLTHPTALCLLVANFQYVRQFSIKFLFFVFVYCSRVIITIAIIFTTLCVDLFLILVCPHVFTFFSGLDEFHPHVRNALFLHRRVGF